MDDLIRKITKNLGVSREQARGGVVALLRAVAASPAAASARP